MSTLIGLKGSCELQKERYGNNSVLAIPVETIEKLLAVVEAAKRVDNSISITPNTDKGEDEMFHLAKALSELDES